MLPHQGRLAWVAEDFSTATYTLMPLAAGINLTGDWLAGYVFHLPLYLDSIGTVLVAALCGPFAAALTGIVSDLVAGALLSPTNAPFAITAAVIGLVAGGLARAGVFRNSPEPHSIMKNVSKVVVAGVLVGVISATVSTPIAAYLFNGLTGGGTDLVVAFFEAHGFSILLSTWLQSLSVDPYDKLITFILVALVVRNLPLRVTGYFPRGHQVR